MKVENKRRRHFPTYCYFMPDTIFPKFISRQFFPGDHGEPLCEGVALAHRDPRAVVHGQHRVQHVPLRYDTHTEETIGSKQVARMFYDGRLRQPCVFCEVSIE